MKGIDIVYHADNNTMELKDAPDDLLIGTDGDDYATYLRFQIIDDEGILDGFSPYVLFEVESRPMIELDESYTLNLTQDLLNKARYGNLPFMLVFKGKESTIEIRSVNTLTLGIAHSIDADREVEDDTPDSELAIKYVEITYHAESRLMELTDMPDDQFVGTDGDDYATYLRFIMDDPDGLLTGYGARVEFDVSIKDDNGDVYKPFIVIDESMSVPLIQRILSNVKYGAIPIQLAFKRTDSEGRSSQFYSLNKLRLSISDSIHAIEDIDVDDHIDFNSAINNVVYNPKTATFSFRQIDGGMIAIQLSDLSEEHFEVDTYANLITLDEAESGDTATVTDTGVWYKLYGDYSVIGNWKKMPGGSTLNGSDTSFPVFYAPEQSGTAGQYLESLGINQSPVWTSKASSVNDDTTLPTGSAVTSYVKSKAPKLYTKSRNDPFYSSSNELLNITNANHQDYAYVKGTDNGNAYVDLYVADRDGNVITWNKKARFYNVSLSQVQWNAVDSGITSTKVGEYDSHISNMQNPHGVTKSQVGLGNVDNTSDINKPISTATQNALDTKADSKDLSELSKIVSDEIADRESSDSAINESISNHVSDTNNPHNVTKEQLGLENVDNTSDVNKPISTATQEALDDKADKTTVSSLRTEFDEEVRVRAEEDTNIKADLDTKADKVETQNALNDKANKSDVETALDTKADKLATEQALDSKADKSIMETALGLKADKTDVEMALDDKADKTVVSSLSNTLTKEIQDRQDGDNTNATAISTHATNKSNPHGVTKAQVGLGNVDNTSDADKPISTATQNALNLKADKSEISSLYRPKGSVATINDLPTNAQIGDVYDVQSTGMNYVWTGSRWDELGAIIDLSPYYTKTEVDSALSGKVSKSGDTMSGELIANGGLRSNFVRKLDSSNNNVGFVMFEETDESNTASLNARKSTGETTAVYPSLKLYANSDATYYATLNSNYIGENDNSDKILTIKMANSLPSLLHSTGNETASGDKTWTGNAKFEGLVDKRANNPSLYLSNTGFTRGTKPSSEKNWTLQFRDSIGISMASIRHYQGTDGTSRIQVGLDNFDASKTLYMRLFAPVEGDPYVTIPTTPSDAEGTQITTANWSIGKFVQKTGDIMTGNLTVGGMLYLPSGYTIPASDDGLRTRLVFRGVGGQTGDRVMFLIDNNQNYAPITILSNLTEPKITIGNNNVSAYAPTPSDKADNSTKIPTTAWINSADIICRTVGNQTIAGAKTFTDNIYLSGNLNLEATSYATKRIYFTDNSADKKQVGYVGIATDSASTRTYIVANRLVEGSIIQGVVQVGVRPDGVTYGLAPQTPSYATGSEIATANWSIGKFVQKSGDTMTGALTLSRDGWNTMYFRQTNLDVTNVASGVDNRPHYIRTEDMNQKPIHEDVGFVFSTSVYRALTSNFYNSDGSKISSWLNIKATPNNGAYLETPSWSVGTNDNSDKIMTIKMANSLPSLVHTTGNETIGGTKTFSSTILRTEGGRGGIINTNLTSEPTTSRDLYNDISLTMNGVTKEFIRFYNTTTSRGIQFVPRNATGGRGGDPLSIKHDDELGMIATAPTTPSSATSNEIATANWVNTKATTLQTNIDGKVSKSGDTMTGNLTIYRNCPSLYQKSNNTNVVLSNMPSSYINIAEQKVLDSKNEAIFGSRVDSDATYTRYFIAVKNYINGVLTDRRFDFFNYKDGTSAFILPQSPASNENSNKVATTGWVNTADSVVHKTGNETITGLKGFTNGIYLKSDGTRAITYRTADNTEDGYISMSSHNLWIKSASGNVTLESPNGKCFAPKTPDDATSNEIATANWSIGKFVQKSGDTMTGELRIYGTSAFTTLINTKSNEFSKFIHLDSTSGSTEWVGVTQAKKWGTNGSQVELIALDRTTNVWKGIYIQNDNGVCIISGVTPSDKADNSTKIATTGWVNTASSVVHTYNAESILGLKTFKDPIHLVNDSVSYTQSQDASTWTYLRGIEFRDKASERMGEIRSVRYTNTVGSLVNSTEIIARGMDNVDTLLAIVTADDGQKYAYCPSTPSNATNNIIATADWSLSKFVNVDGDVMTGLLHLTNGLLLTTTADKAVTDIPIFSTIREIDVSSVKDYQVSGAINMHWSGWTYSGGMVNWRDANFTATELVTESKAGSQTRLTVWQPNDGSAGYLSYPSWSVGTNDNSDKILTIQMANSLPSLVHSYGNETIDGLKRFTSRLTIDQSDSNGDGCIEMIGKWPYIDLHRDNSQLDYTARIWNDIDGRLSFKVKNIEANAESTISLIMNSSGVGYATAPTTPSSATSNEIATANWVNTKLADKITASTTDIGEGSALATGTLYLVYE